MPPKVVRSVKPLYPQGARVADGTPREPRLVKPLATPVALTALEALRKWTFKPAELNGKAIDSNFCLTINFKLD